MSDISPIKAKLDAKVDLTESTNKIINTIVTPFQYLTKGVEKICVAWGGRMIAKSERHNMLEQAQNEKDAEDIKSGKKEYRDGILLNTETMQSPQDYYKQISEHNEYCDAERLNAALLEAAIELSNTPDEEISGDPLDKTFFNRWRAEAELIDDEILRKLWARLLAEETKTSNSVSPRTLDVAKNLSKREIEIFIKNMPGIYAGGIIRKENRQTLASDFSEIIELQEAGLVMATEFATRHLNLPGDINDTGVHSCMVFPGSNFAIAFKTEKISFSCYVLTKAGNELYQMFKKVESLDEIKILAQEVSRQNNTVKYVVYPISSISKNNDGTMTYQFTLTPVWSSAADNGDTK